MLFPLTLYVCLLGLAWVLWRRREILDRNEGLFWYLLSVCLTWAAVFIALIPGQEYASSYGQQVLMFSSFGAVIIGAVGGIVYALWPKTRGVPTSDIFKANLNRFREQPRRDELHDQLKLVYRPLMLAVQEMKQGRDTLPKAGSVGNYDNPWTRDPKIIAQIVDIFDKHLLLVENEVVRKGWEENKDCLRKGEFWYGKEQRKWLENIERQHTLINWWLHSP